jgi:5'-nucleotidase
MLLNVNIPAGVEPRGYMVTRLGKHSYGYEVVEKVDPRGRKYYWIGGNEYQHENIPGSDCNAVLRERLVSVTPLHLDLTDDAVRAQVERWPVEGFARCGPAPPSASPVPGR